MSSPNWQGAQKCSREFFESHIEFLGLFFFENKLKKNTLTTIAELHDAEIPTEMCTGDALNTAIAVARSAGIMPLGQSIFVPQIPESLNANNRLCSTSDHVALVWTDVDLPRKADEQLADA